MRENVGQLIIILSISIILAKMKVSCESIKYIQQSGNLSAIWNFLTKKPADLAAWLCASCARDLAEWGVGRG